MDETISAELDELQRRYRIMEGDRKSYAEEVQNVVRKQKGQIEKLKRENNQLKAELSLQSRASTLGETGIVSTRMTQLQDATDAITRAVEVEKRRAEELDLQTRSVKEDVMAERKEMGGNNAASEQNYAIAKQTKVLEHRLHRALVKFNEAIAANKELREDIDNLRRECAPQQPNGRSLPILGFSCPPVQIHKSCFLSIGVLFLTASTKSYSMNWHTHVLYSMAAPRLATVSGQPGHNSPPAKAYAYPTGASVCSPIRSRPRKRNGWQRSSRLQMWRTKHEIVRRWCPLRPRPHPTGPFSTMQPPALLVYSVSATLRPLDLPSPVGESSLGSLVLPHASLVCASDGNPGTQDDCRKGTGGL